MTAPLWLREALGALFIAAGALALAATAINIRDGWRLYCRTRDEHKDF